MNRTRHTLARVALVEDFVTRAGETELFEAQTDILFL